MNPPYIRDTESTTGIMTDVCIALIPATVFGVYTFGMQALVTIIISILTCVVSEIIFRAAIGRRITIYDGSACVTGLMLALTLPPVVPWWIPVLGGVFAIIVVKELYGGLGKNIMNPALAARCFLLISFARPMTCYQMPFVDEVSGATPLAILKNGAQVDIGSLFIGFVPGTIGEVSVTAIMLGALYLVYKRIITATIPVAYITSFLGYIVLYSMLYEQGDIFYIMKAQLFGGGLLFGAFFMATDYVTSPMSSAGQLVYGVIAGILTGLFRTLGAGTEGVSFAILCANMIVPLIDKEGGRQYG